MVCLMQILLAPWRERRLGPESIREVVFGAEDGLVQNMTLIAGMVGATLSTGVIVLAGVVNTIAGVLSMSMGTFLSSQAERDALLATGRGALVVRSPLRDALVMAAAYGVGALVPLAPFAVPLVGRSTAVLAAVALTALGLFALGVLKAAVSGLSRLRAGWQLLALASAAGVGGYLIGVAARSVFGLSG
jgi:VIT1/CCC1 family predicted Fe2+/Mn2+ transporter